MTTIDESKLDDVIEDLRAQMDFRTLCEFREPERIMLKRSMRICGMESLPVPIGDGDRVSGEMICDKCGQDYYHHPAEWRKVGYGNVPFLNVLCDGRLVKL